MACPIVNGLAMKILEVLLWVAGVALLLAYFSGTAWGEHERQRGIAAFAQAREAGAQSTRAAPDRLATLALPSSTAAIHPVTIRAQAHPGHDEMPIAVLRIPRIALEVPIRQGTDEPVLSRGAGLVEGSPLPGTHGNVAIAAHRDSFFRGLREVAVGDLVELDAMDSTVVYRITDLSVVEPRDVHVLDEVGEPALTLVTCYPFQFVGRAPQRFIVRALVHVTPTST